MMHGGEGLMRLDLVSRISLEDIQPEIKLKSAVQVYLFFILSYSTFISFYFFMNQMNLKVGHLYTRRRLRRLSLGILNSRILDTNVSRCDKSTSSRRVCILHF